MKFELDLIRPDRPLDDDPKARRRDTTAHRKELREVTDAVINEALPSNDLTLLVYLSCEVILEVARCLDDVSEDPTLLDFVLAASEHLQNARATMDRGLLLQDWETVRRGAVMVELTVRGICAALSVPYEEAVSTARVSGYEPVRGVLRRAGLIKGEDDGTKSEGGAVVEEPIGDTGAGSAAADGAAGDGAVGLIGGGGDSGGDRRDS
jgi:hypothetical protein